MTRWWVATRMFSEGNLRSCVSGHRKLPERGQQLQRRGDHAEYTGAHRSCAGADLPIPTTEELPADMPDHKLMPFVEGYADKIQQLAELG